MIVVANSHSLRLHFVGHFAENIGRLEPVLPRLAIFLPQARHDEELVAESLIEFDRFG